MNNVALRRMSLALDYLNYLDDHGYLITDLNMIEPYDGEDKIHHPSAIVFERNHQMLSIRSDWTRSILHYRKRFNLDETYLAYYGPVIRDNQTILQAGAEIYDASSSDILDSLRLHLQFVSDRTQQKMTTMIIGDESLVDLYMEKYNLDASIRPLIDDKNISDLADRLSADHPLVRLLTVPVSKQYDLLQEEFAGRKELSFLKELMEVIQCFNLKTIVDLSFRSPQTYYNGFYFQLFLEENSPILSGGQYDDQAFGIGVNLSDGGIV